MLNPIVFDQIRSHATGVYVAPRTRIITPDDQIVKPEQVRVARRMIRDYLGRGHSLRDTIERAQSVDAGERKYIQPNKPNASVHIDSFHDYELCILAKDLRELPQFTEDLDDTFIQEKGLSVLMSVVPPYISGFEFRFEFKIATERSRISAIASVSAFGIHEVPVAKKSRIADARFSK